MKIAIASDHAGFKYKEQIKTVLVEGGHEVKDFGTYSVEASDYPEKSRGAGELPLKDGVYDHSIDALRYFFVNYNRGRKAISRRY